MRDVVYKLLRPFAGHFQNKAKDRLRVLAYHDITDISNFRMQMEYLKKNYSIVTLNQLRGNIEKNIKLPAYPLLITFDDGDISVFQKGLPVLNALNIPAILFIVTDKINSSQNFWWNVVRNQERDKGKSEAEIMHKLNYLKSIPNKIRMKILEGYAYEEKSQLTVQELQELQARGISICNHSHSHPMFNRCTPKEILEELENVKTRFSDWGIGEYDIFAYPNGNYDLNAEKLLIENGIKLAFLFDHKVNQEKLHPLRISRIRVDSDTKLKEFKVKVAGLHSVLLHKDINI